MEKKDSYECSIGRYSQEIQNLQPLKSNLELNRLKMELSNELLIEASSSESSLLEFFQHNLPKLNDIPLKEIKLRVLDDIALRLHGTMLRETDWMAFLNDLGIADNRVIVYLKYKSQWREALPIFLALSGPLMERIAFGDLIKVILKYKRFDVLLEIKSCVESLLKSSESEYWVLKMPTAPCANECENEETKETSKGEEYSYLVDISNKEKSVKNDLALMKTEITTVLILHADEDVNIAIEFSSCLKKASFSVKTLSDFEYLLMMNAFEVIPALLYVADFVVPIVSKYFLKQIRSANHLKINASVEELDNEENFSNNSNNCYIYQLILNEYVHNRCWNFRVRPVMVPNMNWKLLKYDVLLTNSYSLWKKVPDYIDMLMKTKKLLKKGM